MNESYKICKECDRFDNKLKICEVCHCFMPIKTKLPIASCPLGKWDNRDKKSEDFTAEL
jgi:hypothetical protein